MALQEAGMPYGLRVMCDGVIETLGRTSFEGKLETPFTAHPKKDSATGKLYGFGYEVGRKFCRRGNPKFNAQHTGFAWLFSGLLSI